MNSEGSLEKRLSDNWDYCRRKIKNIGEVLAICRTQRIILPDDHTRLVRLRDLPTQQAEELCFVMERQDEENIQKFIDILRSHGSPDVEEILSLSPPPTNGHTSDTSTSSPPKMRMKDILEEAIALDLCDKTRISDDLLSRLEIAKVIDKDLQNRTSRQTAPHTQASELYQTLISTGVDSDYPKVKKALENTRNKTTLELLSSVEKSIPLSNNNSNTGIQSVQSQKAPLKQLEPR